jgi:Raf kinase inhibitor-like YbhB/YbcL family protein
MPSRFATVNVEGGTGTSVPLDWEGMPAEARSLTLAIIDTHPVAHGWVHWLVTDIPVSALSLEEGASRTSWMPEGAVEHPGTRGAPGYGGPQPPAGSGMHDYVATLYALDVTRLPVADTAKWDEVREAMDGHVVGSATLTGRFGR